MGTKYSSIAVSGFNSSPPSDDGSTAASNQVFWATIKTKLADPLNSFASSVNSALVTALDQSVRLVSSSDSTTAADHDKTVQIASTVTSAVTISLLDAATAAAGYIVTVSNQSAIAQTVGRLTASNTINGATSDYTLPAYHSVRFLVASPAVGYVIVGQSANSAPATLSGTETLTNKTLTSPTLVTPALGTPASGVVTNLTGTASININGTVGATTPSTGAFTTISGTGFTSGRVIYSTAGGALTDSANMSFSGTMLTLSGGFQSGSSTTGATLQAYTGGGAFAIYSTSITPGNGNYSFYTTGSTTDVNGSTNARLLSGGAVIGNATSAGFLAGSDNALTLGGASNRWSVVYAGTGAINTSDAREKTDVSPMTAAEIAAAKQIAGEIGVFKFLSAVSEKGEFARKHIGTTVQRVIEIMESHGLSPFSYGFICYDEWPETVSLDREGNEMRKPAGSRYGFRADELLFFIARGIDARLTAAGL